MRGDHSAERPSEKHVCILKSAGRSLTAPSSHLGLSETDVSRVGLRRTSARHQAEEKGDGKSTGKGDDGPFSEGRNVAKVDIPPSPRHRERFCELFGEDRAFVFFP